MSAQDLANAVRERRAQLRLAQADLAARGGPGEITVGKIERGEGISQLRWKTLAALERALEWPDGLVDRILDGAASEEDLRAQVAAPSQPAVLSDDTLRVAAGRVAIPEAQPAALSDNTLRALTIGRLVLALWDELQGDDK